MKNKIFANVKIGKGTKLIPPVIIGFPSQGKLRPTFQTIIGKNSIIRPFTVIYEGVQIGDNFSCGQGVTIREDNIIGKNVSIGTNAVLEPGNRVGNNVRIHTGCFLEYCIIEEDVFIGPHAVFTDDLHPPCPKFKECVKGAKVEKKAKIGANSTILPGITIGTSSLVGAGSVVTKNVLSEMVVRGNPAKPVKKIKDLKCIKGYFKRVYEWED